MGPWREEGQASVGRIGYESTGLTELWDDALGDFAKVTRPLGLTSPFAVDPDTLRVAFQVRGRDIRPKSFTGALQALLNTASPTDRWRVTREVQHIDFEAWSASLDRVIALRASLSDRTLITATGTRVRELIEGTNARMAELVLRGHARPGRHRCQLPGRIREAMDHPKRSYGQVTAIGVAVMANRRSGTRRGERRRGSASTGGSCTPQRRQQRASSRAGRPISRSGTRRRRESRPRRSRT